MFLRILSFTLHTQSLLIIRFTTSFVPVADLFSRLSVRACQIKNYWSVFPQSLGSTRQRMTFLKKNILLPYMFFSLWFQPQNEPYILSLLLARFLISESVLLVLCLSLVSYCEMWAWQPRGGSCNHSSAVLCSSSQSIFLISFFGNKFVYK